MSQRVWVWTGHMWNDRIEHVLEHFGDRITDVSIFGWSVSAQGQLTETFDPTQLDPYREQWPHIRFWGCFRNMDDPDHGPFEIFEALRDSATARSTLADEVAQMFTNYPWLHGVDIDLETGGDERSEESEEIFRIVAHQAHALGRQAGAALPPLTATGSVGGENWVRYAQLGQILDNVEIMSYDFAWGGSAPGPISPGFWMQDVYNWVVSQIDPAKVHMGIPLYAYYWRLHDYPDNLGNEWRGISGTYYSFWQQFTGYTAWYTDGSLPQAGWIAYRDQESRSMWGFLHAYDWLEPALWETATGVDTDTFQGKHYAVRYGLPAGTPQWSIADNSAGSQAADYGIHPHPIVDVDGEEVGPQEGFTLTLEMLRRPAVAATIIDDYATSDQQLETIYRQPGGGSWEHVEVTGDYRQYRGSGELEFNNDFGDQALYVQGRAQFATSGTFSVYSQGFAAEMRNDGRIRLLRDGQTVDTVQVAAVDVGLEPQQGQVVLGLRVRQQSARVYYSRSLEGTIPTVIEETGTSPPGGPTGYDATATVWIDHTYLGDGWWYQPREAVEVIISNTSRTLGRTIREGVEWDHDTNMFRPEDDVDEPETHDPDQWTEYSTLDWGYEHWQDAPLELGEQRTVTIVPTDHDVWWGRIVAFDQAGGFIAYCNDVQAVAHWRSRAEHDWNLGGIAMWSMGQEDVRLWETLAGGEFPTETKILNE